MAIRLYHRETSKGRQAVKTKTRTPNYPKELSELRSTLAWTDNVMAGINESVIVTDRQWRIVYTNDSFAELIGQPRIFLLGTLLWEKLQAVSDLTSPQEIIGKKQFRIEKCDTLDGVFNLKASEDECVVSIKFSYMPKLKQVVVLIRDITEAILIDEMKREFINIVSHQLRTPLSGIMLYTHMLSDEYAGKLTPQQKKLLQTVIVSTDRMVELVNTFLNIARIESGRIKINPKPTNLHQIVKEVITEYRPKAKAAKITIVDKSDPSLPLTNTDPVLVKEVFTNLISNAIKYTPAKGTVTISIGLDDQVIVSHISDTGFGIPKSEQTQVFTRFYRGSNVVKRETEGNGLGLYLVQLIIKSLRGDIWFTSKENKGTAFWFSLPLEATAQNTPARSLKHVIN
jgi:signal transduction histidine kinase